MAKTDKLDLFKQHKDDYKASAKAPAIVAPAAGTYLALAGRGEPGGDEFQARVGAMYAMAFTVKMTSKFVAGRDYKVAPLEALWWHDGDEEFSQVPPESWCWKLLIRTPEFIGEENLCDARAGLEAKGKGQFVSEVALEVLDEGPCVQMLHVGPYDREQITIDEMITFAATKGLILHDLHHEIYLSDPRRTAPERLKTILRHPVQ